MAAQAQPREISASEMEGLLSRVQPLVPAGDYALLALVVRSLLWLTEQIRQHGTTIARLRRLAGLLKSEKTRDVVPPGEPESGAGGGEPGTGPAEPGAGGGAQREGESAPAGNGSPGSGEEPPALEPKRPKAKGHGRLPASAYRDAKHIPVPHESLRPGDPCPDCGRGTLFDLQQPAQFLVIVGQPPLAAVCWDCQRLRCSACGAIHTAQGPCEAQGPKFSESATAMLAVLRYDGGMPLHRLERIQASLLTPVPASTQWKAVDDAAIAITPALDELVRQAAQATQMSMDDSHARILELMGKRRAALVTCGKLDDPERTGLHTTALLSTTTDGRQIARFVTGRKHAGENIDALLEKRAPELSPPTLMSDALACNNPKDHKVVACHCLAHARRNFVDEVVNYPRECRHVLELLGRVFKVDAICREKKLSDDERLVLHQRESAPVMAELELWLQAQFDEKRIEPNSDMGRAINYMLKRWERFALFLRLPGAPLQNNACERALKMAIRHRNNSLFYKTEHGATVGDLYMSLIYTAVLNGANPFDYLTALLIHARAVADKPAEWMPWNYRDTLARLNEQRAQGPPGRAAA